jgi:MoaA/NifB/PqqE/SkfB family radical SAM enzyme
MKSLKFRALSGIKLAKSYIAYKFGYPQITYVFYTIAARCNLKCSFCNCWLNKGRELDTSTNLAIIDKLAKAGIACISFSGGEPLLREDLEILAMRAKKHNIVSTLNTNGTLVTSERAKKLDKCFEGIAVSIDGFENTHDRIRGVKGAFRRAMDGIAVLKKYARSAKIGVNMTIFRENIKETIPLFEYLQDKVDFVSFQPIAPYPPSKNIIPSHEEVEQLVQLLLILKEKKPGYLLPPKSYIRRLTEYFSHNLRKFCDAGKLYCYINWDGNVMLCPTITSYSIGSIVEEELKKIIQNAQSKACQIRKKCRGCFLTCTNMPSMQYNQPLLNSEIVELVKNWMKL